MKQQQESPFDRQLVEVVLEGGPSGLPTELRTRSVDATDRKIKIPYNGGYEHFELVDDPPEYMQKSLLIYRWTMRTKIAE